ncbi:limbic system-associated membrane protein isoform X2 [Crotalus tigris]|uniref:limbic system-associated membrane protein isoform X2 n=1 Tax=Crotalus tigris TaxID=88082 RepID=UPI00192F2357|nr:limbic system-associated membrane protein isoform X2 [Crotalus tigris]
MVGRAQPDRRQFPLVLLRLLCLLPTGLPVRSVDYNRGTDNITVRQGDTAILRCFIEDKSSKVAWLNRSGIIFAGQDKWSLDPRVELQQLSLLEYSLRIQKVDIYDEGSYTCSVQTLHHPKTSQVYLIVQVPPKISNISSDVTVNEGSNVTLVCMANGRPEPVITWRHLTPTGREFEGEEEFLEILGITREQSGKYECKAANEVSTADVKQVRVTVNYPPTITESKSNVSATGRPVSLKCAASAVPTPDFEWYRDDTRINSANGLEIKSIGSQSFLTVTNVTEEHYGNYTCVATNKLGISNASLFLYRPGTGIAGNGSMCLAVPLWLLAASVFCLLSKC